MEYNDLYKICTQIGDSSTWFEYTIVTSNEGYSQKRLPVYHRPVNEYMVKVAKNRRICEFIFKNRNGKEVVYDLGNLWDIASGLIEVQVGSCLSKDDIFCYVDVHSRQFQD